MENKQMFDDSLKNIDLTSVESKKAHQVSALL